MPASASRRKPMICSSEKRFFTSNLRLVGDWTPNRPATQRWGDVATMRTATVARIRPKAASGASALHEVRAWPRVRFAYPGYEGGAKPERKGGCQGSPLPVTRPDPSGSPDPHAVFRLDVERIAFLDAEGVVPGVDVAQRGEGADVARRVRVAHQLLAQGAVAPQGAPHLGPAQEEALLAGEAVDHRGRLAAQRAAVGLQGDGQATEVAD